MTSSDFAAMPCPLEFQRLLSKRGSYVVSRPLQGHCSHSWQARRLDERQITHLICARLKYDLYDFFGGCFGAFYTRKRKGSRPKTPRKSHIDHILGGHRLDE